MADIVYGVHMAGASTITTLHEAAVARGAAGYFDPDSGLYVLTAAFLEARGRCCGTGCRHCPYPPEMWPPQKRWRRGA